jgi:aminopeptidase N
VTQREVAQESRDVASRCQAPKLTRSRSLAPLGGTALLFFALALPSVSRADRPYAPSRDYDLQDLHTHLWFDVAHRKVRGEVIERIATLRDNVSQLTFDSTDLTILRVEIDGKNAKFNLEPNELVVSLGHAAARGEHHEVFIRYQGQPKKGLFFILPTKDYPQQPIEIWSQGEAEDTHDYIPLYDYPNDRTTSEMLLTVPASWITVSNGRLVSTTTERDGDKTWDWKQSQPISTYLITVVAGDFVERDTTWHGIPLRYVVPRGNEADIESTFARTEQMLELFSSRLGVPYPWAQYAQTAVNDFTAGGMENTSATTIDADYLVVPQLASEERDGSDLVTSHELSHQWFGDLVTCKDWTNLWLNEGFATFFERYWMEQHYGADDAAYEYWTGQNHWFRQPRLYPVPIVNPNFDGDSVEYEGDVYNKAGWVLRMLREKLGDHDFFAALRHYLEVNRGQNVVTADLAKAIEQATSTSIDKFFYQWLYRAGAPEFDVSYTYDSSARQVTLKVAQTQKIEGLVGLFDVPIEVEITTVGGRKSYPIEVNEATQIFTFPSDGEPLMVLFDKGDKLFKRVTFKKDLTELIYQLKNASDVSDRADAVVALGALKDDSAAIAALSEAAQHDPFWGIRVEAIRALDRIGGADAEKPVLAETQDGRPWVREAAVRALAGFKDSSLPERLTAIAANDSAYRVRGAALVALGETKAPDAFDILAAAVKSDSPDDVLRRDALAGLGTLGDNRAAPILLDWYAPGKPFRTRSAAIAAIARFDRGNSDITKTLISYLHEPYLDVRISTVFALAERGDPAAIGPLQDLLNNGGSELSEAPDIRTALSILKSRQGSN